MSDTFRDRTDAGRKLAGKLMHFAGREDVLVLALPRGGVVVAFEIASAIGAPLDVFVVRKLGVPGHGELAMGAIATGGIRVLNEDLVASLGITESAIDAVTDAETRELRRRESAYRGHRAAPDARKKTVILVDDGIATGATMRAAIDALRLQDPARIVVAVPAAAAATCEELRSLVHELVTLVAADAFFSVSQWYEEFPQTTDEEVTRLLGLTPRAGADQASTSPLRTANRVSDATS